MMLMCSHSVVHIQLDDEGIQNLIEHGVIDWQIDNAVLDDEYFLILTSWQFIPLSYSLGIKTMRKINQNSNPLDVHNASI